METFQNERIEGNPQEWDTVWKSDKENISDEVQLFTRGKIKNIRQLWQRCYFNDLFSLVKDRNYNSFLELGSGRGTTSLYLMNSGYTNITMVDLAPEAFKLAKKLFENANLPVPNLILSDVRETQLPDESYDCIYNIGLLEHFRDPEPVLKEAYRLLKPGGLIFMVIIPEYPISRSIPLRLFLNPISVIKFIVKRIIKRKSVVEANMVRTYYSGNYYKNILNKLGEKNAVCIPYNSYHKIFVQEKYLNLIALPFFKIQYAAKSFFCKPPILKTNSKLAFCDLLICYKTKNN